MVGSAEILTAIRELTNTKQLDRTELHGLLQDGIYAALAKKHGPNVKAEVDIDEDRGTIRIVLLKTVVDEVTDPSTQISLDEARFAYRIHRAPVRALDPDRLEASTTPVTLVGHDSCWLVPGNDKRAAEIAARLATYTFRQARATRPECRRPRYWRGQRSAAAAALRD